MKKGAEPEDVKDAQKDAPLGVAYVITNQTATRQTRDFLSFVNHQLFGSQQRQLLTVCVHAMITCVLTSLFESYPSRYGYLKL